jgi:crotonobetainyl-CoA:carnitine CoA-transferase CaiB-like acyl-CoA transferase
MFSMLGDIKVIELTNSVGAAACAKMLGDLGADVLKIEPPRTGDATRYEPPFLTGTPDPDAGALFLAYNTNKKGITLNLESETGKELFRKLIADADVVVESYRPGYLDSIGLGYAKLKEINPKVVLTSITPFGQTGPYKDWTTSDLVIQAIGGHLITGGDKEREPMAFPDTQSAYITGRNGSIATMAAVLFQRQTGRGQHVDVSEVEAFAQVWHANGYTFGGRIGGRGGGGGQENVMDSMHLKAKDGYVTFTTAGTHPKDPMDVWGDFLGEPQIKEKKWKSAKVRRDSWRELKALVENKLANMTMKEFFNKAMEWRLAVGMVQSPQVIVDCPHLEFRHSLAELDHPVVGKLKYPGPGALLDNQNPLAGGTAAPRLGQHNGEVYGKRLGLSQEQMNVLAGAGVI